MNKIIALNSTTPFFIDLPSAAPSILKAYLTNSGYRCDVIYWNLIFHELENEFLWNSKKFINDQSILYLYYNYLAIRDNDEYIYNNIKVILQALNPSFLRTNDNYYDNHMRIYAKKMDDILEEQLHNYSTSEILFFGFTLKLDQWFVASIISEKMKIIHPKIPIIVGGLNTKDSAKIFIESFPFFDLAMWGECEKSLVELTKELEREEKSDYSHISNLFYRKNNIIAQSLTKKTDFIDLSEPDIFPDYSDFFDTKRKFGIRTRKTYLHTSGAYLPIEGSRGCHWGKCNFCYLNTGYKYRLKSITKISEEIRYMMKTYNIKQFEFLDNDLIGKNLTRFNELLDELICIRNEEPEFRILVAEIISKGVDKSTIKKMSKAGIKYVQIGYESTSDTLLKKINKKNTFSSNLFFIKYAQEYKIGIGGVNIMMNLPEEQNEDIIESINNLRFLRFYFNRNDFKHTMNPLCVNHSSKYYKEISKNIECWEPFDPMYYITKRYLKDSQKIHIFNYINAKIDLQWDSYKKIENYYLTNIHTYTLSYHNNRYTFIEKVNSRDSFHFDMEEQSLEIEVLKQINDSVLSLDQLYEQINMRYTTTHYLLTDLKEILKFFFERGIVYHNHNYQEIVSIINTDKINYIDAC